MAGDKRLLTLAGASVLLLASSVPFVLPADDPFEASGLRPLILQLRGLDAALTSDVLQLRLGALANYDSLVARNREIQERTREFVERSARLPARARLARAFEHFLATAAERDRILEAFPIDNATLNNSLRLLGATYRRAHLGDGAPMAGGLAARLDQVHRLALQYYSSPDPATQAALQAALAADWTGLDELSGAAVALLGHARIVVQQASRVEEHVRGLVANSGEKALLDTFVVFEEEARAASQRAAGTRALVHAACVLAVVVTCAAGVWTVLRQNAALEREVRERIRADQEARKLESELRQAQKLEAIGQLAAGIAHEINTPVQFVGDSVHFAREAMKDLAGVLAAYGGLEGAVAAGTATPQAAQAVKAAVEEADLGYLLENLPRALERSLEGLERVATIVRSLKEFAHPEEKEMSPADLNRAIQSTLTIARSEYKYVADVVTELGDLPSVNCLVGSLNQVVLNIVVNAAHAIADVVRGTEARGRITVRTWREGDEVVISIGDTGAGIPEAIRERVFDPFFTTKEVGKGTGQGLAIARTVVVEKHHGALTFESESGKGTTFFIRLPIAGAGSARPALEAAA